MRGDYKKLSRLFKVLGGDVRLDLLRYLLTGEKCVCKIFAHLQLPQNLVSHHLGVLRKNQFISARKDGKWVHYSLNSAVFLQLRNGLDAFVSAKKIKSKC